MTKSEASEAKMLGTPVHVKLSPSDTFYGVIVQVGFHESGNDDLVAVQGVYSTEWFHRVQVKKG